MPRQYGAGGIQGSTGISTHGAGQVVHAMNDKATQTESTAWVAARLNSGCHPNGDAAGASDNVGSLDSGWRVSPERSPHALAGTRTSTRELARSGKKKPQPGTVGASLLVADG